MENQQQSQQQSLQKSSSSKKSFDEFMKELETNRGYVRDVNLMRRVNLYRMRGELGTGNFSIVKMAVHEITDGKF